MTEVKLTPAVFAVDHDYHIMFYSEKPCLMWVKVGDKTYYDESNGILRSHTVVHRVIVPMKELNKALKYVVCLRYIIDRKPYFPEIEPVEELEYIFRPVTNEKQIRALSYF